MFSCEGVRYVRVNNPRTTIQAKSEWVYGYGGPWSLVRTSTLEPLNRLLHPSNVAQKTNEQGLFLADARAKVQPHGDDQLPGAPERTRANGGGRRPVAPIDARRMRCEESKQWVNGMARVFAQFDEFVGFGENLII